MRLRERERESVCERELMRECECVEWGGREGGRVFVRERESERRACS